MNVRKISPIRNVFELLGAIVVAPFAFLLMVANPMLWILFLSGNLKKGDYK